MQKPFVSGNPWTWLEWTIIAVGAAMLLILVIVIVLAIASSKKKVDPATVVVSGPATGNSTASRPASGEYSSLPSVTGDKKKVVTDYDHSGPYVDLSDPKFQEQLARQAQKARKELRGSQRFTRLVPDEQLQQKIDKSPYGKLPTSSSQYSKIPADTQRPRNGGASQYGAIPTGIPTDARNPYGRVPKGRPPTSHYESISPEYRK